MHYIRFLKLPRRNSRGGKIVGVVSAKITVTTDLGDAFLWEDLVLIVGVSGADGKEIGKGKEVLWKGRDGMRSLEVVLPLEEKVKGVRMIIRPKEERFTLERLETLVSRDKEGRVVAVRSMDIDSRIPGTVPMVERVFTFGNGEEIRIWEETGESIARHIWDAGLLLSSCLCSLSLPPSSTHSPAQSKAHLPSLSTLLSRSSLNILELGAGCGIVGITFSKLLSSRSKILLTDLPEASEILSHNLSSLSSSSKPSSLNTNIEHRVLDWSSPLPLDIQETEWELVVVADCTYNPDVVPDLVGTLKSIRDGNGEVGKEMVVLLAMKVRHESEMVFFELMKGNGFAVIESCQIPLPVLGGEGQEIEIFVFV